MYLFINFKYKIKYICLKREASKRELKGYQNWQLYEKQAMMKLTI